MLLSASEKISGSSLKMRSLISSLELVKNLLPLLRCNIFHNLKILGFGLPMLPFPMWLILFICFFVKGPPLPWNDPPPSVNVGLTKNRTNVMIKLPVPILFGYSFVLPIMIII